MDHLPASQATHVSRVLPRDLSATKAHKTVNSYLDHYPSEGQSIYVVE
jgi:hypothetical protein